MDICFGQLKAILVLVLILASSILSGCGSSGGCTVVPASATVSGTTAQGPHCASETASATSGYSISGVVSGGTPLGVTIKLTGAGTGSTTTDANGNYNFSAIPNGNYTVTPSRAGYFFSPANIAVTIGGANASGNNFTEAASTGVASGFSGTVAGAVAQNVTITLSGANAGSAVTDAGGNFGFSGLAVGTYTVTPSLASYVFSPASSVVTTISGENVTLSTFTASFHAAATSRFFGRVSGAVAQNVMITLSGANAGSAVTDAGGNFGFSGLAAGAYTLTPSLAGYIFSPANIAVTTSGGESVILTSFTATR